MEIKFVYILYGIFLLFSREIRAVKIENMTVPSRYELSDENSKIIMNCDYSVEPNERGFVLKWLHNSVLIYQWIPNRKPFALPKNKDRIDTNYATIENGQKRFSTLVITKPLISDSGNYTCNIQTFESNHKETREMIVVDPPDAINLKYKFNEDEQKVELECSVLNVSPFPEVKILFDNEEKNFEWNVDKHEENNVYNITISTEVHKADMKDESPLECVVSIPSAEYEKTASIIYDDPKQSASTKISDLGELTKKDDTNENDALPVKSCSLLLLVTFASLMLTS